MKRYRTQSGVVLTTIDGQYILVSAKSVRDKCPYTTQINETAAFCWRILEQGAGLDELCAAMQQEYEIDDPDALRADLVELLAQLESANYLIEDLENGGTR